MIELWYEWNSVQSFKMRVVLAEKGLNGRGDTPTCSNSSSYDLGILV
jgi:hypothetical protein